MVYDHGLAGRVQAALDEVEAPKLDSKKMFGGICMIGAAKESCFAASMR